MSTPHTDAPADATIRLDLGDVLAAQLAQLAHVARPAISTIDFGIAFQPSH